MRVCEPYCTLYRGHAGGCRFRHRGSGPTCDAWMRNARERCARQRDHGGEHRSRYALDNAAQRHRSGWAA